jgi:hypothetical protein
MKVLAINRTYKKVPGMIAVADIFAMDSRSLYHEEKQIALSESDVKETFSLAPALTGAKGIKFVILNLKDSNGKTISHNAYWLSENGDYRSLNDIQRTKVDTKVIGTVKGKNETSWTIQITNSTDRIAFFIRPQLISAGEEILPGYWSSGYFTLAPSEVSTITVSCPIIKIYGKNPEIRISGWNVSETVLPIN